MIEHINIALVFTAGLASVLSPCVLPVLPIVITGTGEDYRLRPLLTVAGLTASFVLMGVLSSLFGASVGRYMYYVEKVTGMLIVIFGLLLLFDINLFKRLQVLPNLSRKLKGKAGGFFLGAILGIVWIPCIGPILSGVLAMTATKGSIQTGILLLLVYSLGFSIPMLIAGYASHFFRTQFRKLGGHSRLVNVASGAVLVALGIFIIAKGMTGFGF